MKKGHVVGLDCFLVLIPSKESVATGYANAWGHNCILACRFAHGAGRTRFSRVRGTPRERANILNFLARIFGSGGISAHFGGPVLRVTSKKTRVVL